MNNIFVKILRFIVFFPICFIAIYLINVGFAYLIVWLSSLSGFWLFFIFFFLFSSIWGLFQNLASALILLTTFISPIRGMGSITISILSIANGLFLWYKIWTAKAHFTGWEMFIAFAFSLMVFELTYALIFGAIRADKQHYQ